MKISLFNYLILGCISSIASCLPSHLGIKEIADQPIFLNLHPKLVLKLIVRNTANHSNSFHGQTFLKGIIFLVLKSMVKFSSRRLRQAYLWVPTETLLFCHLIRYLILIGYVITNS